MTRTGMLAEKTMQIMTTIESAGKIGIAETGRQNAAKHASPLEAKNRKANGFLTDQKRERTLEKRKAEEIGILTERS
jgi:hypothetical protein